MKTVSQISCLVAVAAPALAFPFPWHRHYTHSSPVAKPVFPTLVASPSAGMSGPAGTETGTAWSTGTRPAWGTGTGTAWGTGTVPPAGPTPTVTVAFSSPTAASSVFPSLTSPSSGVAAPTGTSTPEPANGTFLRGINIGNWLILEPWMDSDGMFSGDFAGAVDQWSLDSIDGAADKLQTHWESWFTEDDVTKLAGWGFNALRIP